MTSVQFVCRLLHIHIKLLRSKVLTLNIYHKTVFCLNRRQLKQYCMYLIKLVNTCSRSFFFLKTSQSEPRRVNNFSMTLDDAVSSITSVYSVGNDAFSPEDTLDSI